MCIVYDSEFVFIQVNYYCICIYMCSTSIIYYCMSLELLCRNCIVIADQMTVMKCNSLQYARVEDVCV